MALKLAQDLLLFDGSFLLLDAASAGEEVRMLRVYEIEFANGLKKV